jgi:phosphoribosyl 1,2-cyclic phosphodiesterase
MVECGLEYPKLRKALTTESIDLMRVSGCLITHAHSDHCKGANVLSRFITVYASQETIDRLELSRYKPLIEAHVNVIHNEWKVIPFTVEHDISGAYGFIIKSNDHSLLFVNDTKLVEWNLSAFKFNTVMIECNYVDELIDMESIKSKRTINSHMALSTTIATLKALDLSKCEAIYLMHLSDGNSNERLMIDTVNKATGIKTYACGKWGNINE